MHSQVVKKKNLINGKCYIKSHYNDCLFGSITKTLFARESLNWWTIENVENSRFYQGGKEVVFWWPKCRFQDTRKMVRKSLRNLFLQTGSLPIFYSHPARERSPVLSAQRTTIFVSSSPHMQRPLSPVYWRSLDRLARTRTPKDKPTTFTLLSLHTRVFWPKIGQRVHFTFISTCLVRLLLSFQNIDEEFEDREVRPKERLCLLLFKEQLICWLTI